MRKLYTLLFFPLLLLLLKPVAGSAQRQNLLFESSFEWTDGTYLNGFNTPQACCSHSVARTMAGARSGAGALRLEVNYADPLYDNSTVRSELTIPTVADTGERWYGISFFLKDWAFDSSRHSILQWHPDSSGGSSVMALLANEGVLTIVHGDPFLPDWKYINTGPVVSDVWTDFVFHVKWDSTNNGYIQVWRDGVLVYDTSGIQTSWGKGQYVKAGIYHFGWTIDEFDEVDQRVLFIDDLRIGNGDATYADVAPLAPPRKHLVFDAQFEGTDYLNGFNPEEYTSCCEFSITQNRDFAREGAYATRLEVNDTDEVVSGSHGAELTFENTYDVGERWYGMSYYFGNYAYDSSNESILNWHPNTPGGGPVLGLFVQGNMLTLVHQIANSPWDDYHYEDIVTVPLNQWVDVVFHVKWTDDNTGFIEFYLNGNLVYSAYSIRTDWADGQYMKVGINKFCWAYPCTPASTVNQRVLWVDALRIGDENSDYEDVAPGGVASCIQPTATLTKTESCDGAPYYLVLDAATGTGPFDLWINDTTYYNVAVGDSITLISPVEEHIFSSQSSTDEGALSFPLELGVRFKSSKPGFIKGIRFFSSTSVSGTYEGHLWKSDGTLLASATFTGVTGSSWQQVLFSAPVMIDTDSLYVASYNSSDGRYTRNATYFHNRSVTNGSLTAPGSDQIDHNGVLAFGSNVFPTANQDYSNFWVDVVFVSTVDTIQLLGVTNAGGCTRTGDLQQITVVSEECVAMMRSAAPSAARPVIAGYKLEQNYPNPYRGNTTIRYMLPQRSPVNLSLYDINGRLIKVLVNGSREAGTHTLNMYSGSLQSGIYYYRIQAGKYTEVKKMVVQ